jgi:hypothetical protein
MGLFEARQSQPRALSQEYPCRYLGEDVGIRPTVRKRSTFTLRVEVQMVRLRVLGSVDLIDDGGRDLVAVLAQPKRLALLTYLVLARPPGFHRREVLLSLLWPQSDQGTARNSLRQALHFLRHALGDAVIVSRGEKDVGVDHSL